MTTDTDAYDAWLAELDARAAARRDASLRRSLRALRRSRRSQRLYGRLCAPTAARDAPAAAQRIL